MASTAALISAIAALISSLAWPVLIAIIVFIFRSPIRIALGRAENVKLGSFFEAKLRAEAHHLVERAVIEPADISGGQIESATRIQIAARSLDDRALRHQLDQLCLAYENIRSSMGPGSARTLSMTEVLVRMRTLAPSVVKFLKELKDSEAPGDRLAAVAIMQIEPKLVDYDWLLERFSTDVPFIFFHAAVAMQNALKVIGAAALDPAKHAAEAAFSVVQSFEGEPDQNTLDVLKAIMAG